MGKGSTKDLSLLVAEHLPDIGDRVLKMANKDEDFHELVMDYFECVKEISKMRDSDQNRTKSQFLETLEELKSEIDSTLMGIDD